MTYVLSTCAASVKCKSILDVIKSLRDAYFEMFSSNLRPYFGVNIITGWMLCIWSTQLLYLQHCP